MNKTLKFAHSLVPLILDGKKISTWRLYDDKDLCEGDTVDFIDRKSGKYFSTARIIKLIEKTFGKLTEEDKIGHEKFRNDKELYETYEKYYKKKVTPKTLVKIIWFVLLK